MERMDDGRIPKKAMPRVEVGRRGRPRLRWKDYVERILGGLVGMMIGGSGLWIGGGGEPWTMMLLLVSVFFLTPCKGCMR